MPGDIFTTVRAMFDAWNDGAIDRMPEFWTEDGDWVWEDAPDFPADQRTHRGRDAVEAHLREIMGLLGTLRIEVEDLFRAGDEIVVVIRAHVEGAQSGVQFDEPAGIAILHDGDRVRRMRNFSSRADAVSAAESSAR